MELSEYTDRQLREELQRRAAERRKDKQKVLRCKDCKFCATGYTSKRRRTTTICAMRPKIRGEYVCYYATSCGRKACDIFELKDPNDERIREIR